jgi:hypothetical protein
LEYLAKVVVIWVRIDCGVNLVHERSSQRGDILIALFRRSHSLDPSLAAPILIEGSTDRNTPLSRKVYGCGLSLTHKTALLDASAPGQQCPFVHRRCFFVIQSWFVARSSEKDSGHSDWVIYRYQLLTKKSVLYSLNSNLGYAPKNLTYHAGRLIVRVMNNHIQHSPTNKKPLLDVISRT